MCALSNEKSMTQDRDLCNDESTRTPIIEPGVPGPRDDDGFLLRAPRSEELTWDLEAEVLSARREWIEEHQAWWIASSYLESVIGIVLRSFPTLRIRGGGQDRLISRDRPVLLGERLT